MQFTSDDFNDEDIVDVSARLRFRHIVKMSRLLSWLFFALSALLILPTAALAVFMTFGVDSSFASTASGIVDGALTLIGFVCYAVSLFVAGLIFRDISHGEAPFTAKQSKRIRIIAWMLLSIALIEAVLPLGVIVDNALGGSVFGAVNASSYTPPIRIGSIIVAVVFFFLSSVFDYGVKLQEISNETV